jgi:thioesterase domain-containing protein
VMISQRAFANHLWSMVRAPGIAATDTVLALTSISFDIAGLELLLALIVGAKVVIAPRSLATDGRALGALLDRHAVTLMQATPAGWRLLIESGWQGRSQLKIITGGEPLLRSLADELLTRVDQLWDLYGPTETTVYSTGGPILADGELVTIGRPVANTQTYILDAQMQPVPIGAIGELYIGGDGVALGYLNRPDLTAERFVPDLFRPETHAKLYRTGDLARYLSDGRIEYLGRIDNQVKIRGYRIELGEIESNLEQHPTVRQAVVIAREDNPDDGPRLVAYVLGRTSNNAPQPTALRSHLRQILPDYMLPAAFVVLEKFPLTPSGKVDRKALPKPEVGRREPATANAVSAPLSPLEAQLLPLWEAILGVPVTVDDNFFELGGHSLLAARLCDRMAQMLGRSLSPTVLFRSPTVAQLALALGVSAALDVPSSAVVIQPGTGDGPPLFAIHVLGEGGRFFRPLAQQLGAAQTVYGLAAQMMDKENAPPNRVEDLAAFYIREMRQIQPTGPYYLVGISYGGMVAYEMARQMQQQGLVIGMIGLLDSYGPHPMLGLPSHDRLKAHWRSAREQGLSSYLKHKLGRMLGQRSTQLHCAYGRLVRRLGGQISYEMQYKLVVAENIQAAAAYVPGRFEGRLVLFRATAAVFYSQDYLESGLGWRNLVAELAVYDVPGTHMTMVEAPQVRALAAVLGRVAFAVGNPMPTTDGQFPCLVGGAIL